jgi:uncharacterized protein (DUF2235 family)
MSRNLIICLDGTDNEFCAHNTNVVRLFQSLDRKASTQVAYYDPGVGTIWEPGTLSKLAQRIQMLLGLAFGLGVSRNVAEAYAFLIQHHQMDDRIFIFGFSRGALEARAVAALVYRCGLLESQLHSLEPYALRLSQTHGNYEVVREFKRTFSRDVTVEFLGLWDTVTSMGNVWSPIYWPHTTSNPGVRRVAHAIAIDERRAFFRPNRWMVSENQTVSEVWFSGVHSDVGGGYVASTGRLWAITLEWMLGHGHAAGLLIDDSSAKSVLAAGSADSRTTPDFASDQHDSLTTAWKALELVPKSHQTRNADGSFGEPRLLVPAIESGFRGRPRTLAPGEKVHRTVLERIVARPDYRPETLAKAGLTPAIAKDVLQTGLEVWTVPDEGRR